MYCHLSKVWGLTWFIDHWITKGARKIRWREIIYFTSKWRENIFFTFTRRQNIFSTFSVTEDIHGDWVQIFFSPLMRRNLFISPILRRNLFISKFFLAPRPLDILWSPPKINFLLALEKWVFLKVSLSKSVLQSKFT